MTRSQYSRKNENKKVLKDLLPLLTRTVNTGIPQQVNLNAKGIMVILHVSVASGTGGLKLKIRTPDPSSGVMLDLNADPTAVTTAGFYIYTVYPGVISAGGTNSFLTQGTSAPLPKDFDFVVMHSDASNYTYSVSATLID